MSRNSKKFFESLSNFCYVSKTTFSFRKRPDNNEYDKGSKDAYRIVDELCYHYLQKEKKLKSDFLLLLNEKIDTVRKSEDSAYKKGMLKAFANILDIIKSL